MFGIALGSKKCHPFTEEAQAVERNPQLQLYYVKENQRAFKLISICMMRLQDFLYQCLLLYIKTFKVIKRETF